jgi:hypothetical protein
MLTSNEIQAAMEWANSTDRSAVAGGEVPIATLAACVWELYELLDMETRGGGDPSVFAMALEVVDRYRDALEGGNSESR